VIGSVLTDNTPVTTRPAANKSDEENVNNTALMVKQVTTKQIIHSYLNTDILSVHCLIFFQRYQLAPRERREAGAHAHALIVLVLSFERIVN
jgi:hypothetical protein